MPILSSFGGGSSRGFKFKNNKFFDFLSYTFSNGGASGSTAATLSSFRQPVSNPIDAKASISNLGVSGGYGMYGQGFRFTVSKVVNVHGFFISYYEYIGTPNISITVTNYTTGQTLNTSSNYGHGSTNVQWAYIGFSSVLTFDPAYEYAITASPSNSWAQNSASVSSSFTSGDVTFSRTYTTDTNFGWGFKYSLPVQVPAWLNNNEFYNVGDYQGQQLFTIPEDGLYRITAAGASGGKAFNNTSVGSGAVIRGDFSLSAGTKLKIVVGHMGGDGTTSSANAHGGGGGGGTFVALSNNIPLIVGGGGSGASNGKGGRDANTSSNGYGSRRWDNTEINNGGTGGNGGGIDVSGVYSSAGGGGFYGNGADNTNAGGGKSFINGSSGGWSGRQGYGGFGGGGGGDLEGGGGGGYSGGGGSYHGWSLSGGGGSYNIGSNQTATIGNVGHGYVTITKL